MLLLFSHGLTAIQQEDAQKSLRVDTFIPLPDELKEQWANIPADIKDISRHIEPMKQFVTTHARQGDIVLIQGDFGATYSMVKFAFDQGYKPVYATTKRESTEVLNEGKLIKTSVFEHVMFRMYEES